MAGLGDDGRYLWSESMRAGDPPVLFGRPIVTDPQIVDQGTGNRSVLFGDLSAFSIREAGALRFESSRDAGFSTDTTVFRAILRTDSGLADNTAVKCGIHP